MLNIPEREPNQTIEPRSGVAPFAEGIERKRTTGGIDAITTKPIRFGDLGNVSLYLL